MDQALNSLIASGKYNDYLAILKGFRNGAVYGAKIRFPHALVMTLLFKRDSIQNMAKSILKPTYQHARNLAVFVTLYKCFIVALRSLDPELVERHWHSFLAGLTGGYIVFGKETPINQQIVLYLFSRVSMGLAKLTVARGWVQAPTGSFSYFAAIVWGLVMWLFRHERGALQGSLQSSMQYLYNDSDIFSSVYDLLWVNKLEAP